LLIAIYSQEYYFHVISITLQEFLTSHNIQLNQPETIEQDAFTKQKKLENMKIPPPDTKEYNEYFEVKLGGGHPNNGL